MLKNGAVFVQENDVFPEFPGDHLDGFGNGPLKIDEAGDVFWFADMSTSSSSADGAYMRNLEVLVQESVTMVGAGLIDEIRGLNNEMNISPNGRWMIFEGELDNVDTVFLMDLMENIAPYCFGDGGDQMGCSDCPCGNNASPGTLGGCLNSNGTAAQLLAFGTASLSSEDLCMGMISANPGTFAVLSSGDAQAPANPANPCFAQNPGSGIQSTSLDGLRCVVQNVLRHGSRAIDANGDVGLTTPPWGYCTNFPNSAGFMIGQTRYFQSIYREQDMLVCQTGQNTTQGKGITFLP
jgi:hypothetical protein